MCLKLNSKVEYLAVFLFITIRVKNLNKKCLFNKFAYDFGIGNVFFFSSDK
jgi:hypothetical protein